MKLNGLVQKVVFLGLDAYYCTVETFKNTPFLPIFLLFYVKNPQNVEKNDDEQLKLVMMTLMGPLGPF